MKSRKFSLDDQMVFAKLSGDYNPLHLDAIVARRLIFGAPVVHGIHSLLWGLDCWLGNMMGCIEFRALNVSFSKPIKVDAEVTVSWNDNGFSYVVIDVFSAGSVCTKIKIEYSKIETHNLVNLKNMFPEKIQPRDLSENEIEGASGTLDLCLDVEMVSSIFPNLLRCLSPLDVAVLLGTTRLVGVQCPGLQSLYFDLSLYQSDKLDNSLLEYVVKKFDRRYSLVSMEIKASSMAGSVRAFFRPQPKRQGNYLEMKKLVNKDEFVRQRALIFGGSRGLGEVAAKLLAAGSADVRITYNKGEADAHHVVDEISSSGGKVESFYLDVLAQQQSALSELLKDWIPTHMYYFVTPFIFAGVNGRISLKLLAEFNEYYITGFLGVLNPLIDAGVKKIFYPSSVGIKEIPLNMGEYIVVKTAGEMLCQFLQKSYGGLKIYYPRLPRMSTDQTVSLLLHMNGEEPAPIMLEHLRLFRDMPITK
jgi:hypothetical protein